MTEPSTDHVAGAETEISASPEQVWAALTDPEAISRFMFGSQVETDWQVGSAITWTGEYDGTSFEDKGEILEVDEPSRLRMTHYSPLSGQPDEPSSYHHLDYRLEASDAGTRLTLEQDGNDSEEQAEQFAANWQTMLDQVKEYVEEGRGNQG
ncbi:SRPBCC family protein [Nocardioides cynanchi]|uniref:SRPBCC family protein n=1 Tax=Nocardioides cynanchi TaxID=2558918 RepID=UPI001248DD8D|nr:SRPBCC family protein [Nocardioides cynanchi]